MGHFFSSITRCDTVEPGRCMSVARKTFQTNPDVAGWGVLCAFAAGAYTALILCSILIIKHTRLLFSLCGFFSRDNRDARQDKAAKTRKGKKIPLVDRIIQDLVLSLSDQQIVTGLALGISALFSKPGCDVSAYHYNIIANLILMTMSTHVCSIVVLPDYFRNPALGSLRIIAIGVVVTLSGLFFAHQITITGFPIDFPASVPPRPWLPLDGNNTTSVALLLPAACYISREEQLRNGIKVLFTDYDGLGNALFKSTINNRVLSGYSQWIILTIMYSVGVIISIGYWLLNLNTENGTWARFARKVVWFCKLLVVVFGIYVSVSTFIYVRRMRSWLNWTEWYKGEVNEENELFTFGQLLPIFLLTLFVVVVLESAHSYERERQQKKEALQNPPTPPSPNAPHTYTYPPTPATNNGLPYYNQNTK